jgi:hypothetical protein
MLCYLKCNRFLTEHVYVYIYILFDYKKCRSRDYLNYFLKWIKVFPKRYLKLL